jgi:hypothetical protein
MLAQGKAHTPRGSVFPRWSLCRRQTCALEAQSARLLQLCPIPTVRASRFTPALEEALPLAEALFLAAVDFFVAVELVPGDDGRRFFAGDFDGGGLGGVTVPASAGCSAAEPPWAGAVLPFVCASAAAERNAPSTSTRAVGSTWNIRSASA